MGWLILLAVWGQEPRDLIETVKAGELDMAAYRTVGDAFPAYRWFEAVTWQQMKTEIGDVVTFTGVIPDEAATKHFYERRKYALHMGLKAMQLESNYGLTEDKVKLSFIIHFAVKADGGFSVHSGELGVLDKAGEWHTRMLTDKALVEVIRGIYIQRNPYESLILGLPFK